MNRLQRFIKNWISPYTNSSLFWVVLVLKLISGTLLGSHFLHARFIPFLTYFVDSHYSNPWNEFLRRGIFDAFPYSSAMLLIMSAPFAVVKVFCHTTSSLPLALQFFLVHIPLLLADVVIYVVLCKWLDSARRSVLLLYWCSPILFYITYVYGHFDVIPTALLLISMVAALSGNPIWAGLLIGVGMAAKMHVAAAVPLVAFFIFKNGANKNAWRNTGLYSITLLATLMVFIGPYLGSEGYRALVLGAKESRWVMEVSWPLPNGLSLLICPAALAALILHFFSYQRVTRDVLVLYTGLLYTTLIVLVPPQVSWSYWCMPFLCYFLIRQDTTRYVPFWAYTVSYLLYFAFLSKDTAFFPIEQWVPVQDADLLRQLTFTGMQTSLALVAVWVYRIGVKSYVQYKQQLPHIAIGIAGDSGSGKHTLAAALMDVLGVSQTVRLHGDDYHRWPRGHQAWDSTTHLDPRSNYFRHPIQHITDLKSGSAITLSRYDHATGTFTDETTEQPGRFVLFEGLHPFVFQRMRDIFNIKIFLATDEALRRYWKIRRDTTKRGYTVEKVVSELERRKDDAKRYVAPQADFADWVIEYSAEDELDVNGPLDPTKLRVRHRVSSQIIEIEILMDQLATVQSDQFRIDWFMSPDLKHQIIEVNGRLAADRVSQIADRVFPDLDGFLKFIPIWKSDLDGINQLLFLAVLNDALKKR